MCTVISTTNQHVDRIVWQDFAAVRQFLLIVLPPPLQNRVLHEQEHPTNTGNELRYVLHYRLGALSRSGRSMKGVAQRGEGGWNEMRCQREGEEQEVKGEGYMKMNGRGVRGRMKEIGGVYIPLTFRICLWCTIRPSSPGRHGDLAHTVRVQCWSTCQCVRPYQKLWYHILPSIPTPRESLHRKSNTILTVLLIEVIATSSDPSPSLHFLRRLNSFLKIGIFVNCELLIGDFIGHVCSYEAKERQTTGTIVTN